MPARSILDTLASEHREAARLLALLDLTTPRAPQRRKRLFARLDQLLSLHAGFEERCLYPLMEAHQASRPIALAALEEHAQITRLLAGLRALDPQDGVWTAKLTVLTEDVRLHVNEEEGNALPRLRLILPGSDLERLDREYQEMKAATPWDGRRYEPCARILDGAIPAAGTGGWSAG